MTAKIKQQSWNQGGIVSTPRTPVVYIGARVKQRLDYYVQAVEGEISGLGWVEKRGRDFMVTSVYLFEQTCSTGDTKLDPSDLARFIAEMIAQGVDPSGLKLWWHSHAHMGVFWSVKDEETIEGFRNGWMLSLVVNKHGDYRARLDVYEPVRVTLDDLVLRVVLEDDEWMREEVEAEVAEKVSEPRFPGWVFQQGWGGLFPPQVPEKVEEDGR